MVNHEAVLMGATIARTDALHAAIEAIAYALQSQIGETAMEVIETHLADSNEARATAVRVLESLS